MTRPALLLPLVIVGISCQPADRPGTFDSADITAVHGVLEEATAAHAAGDSIRIAGLFADDAIIMPDDLPTVTGRAEVLSSFGSLFRDFNSTARIEPVETRMAGDWAFVLTRVSGTLVPKTGGPTIELRGREIAILRRQDDGSWKVARLIGNSSPPGEPNGAE